MLLSVWEERDENNTSGANTVDWAHPPPVHFSLVLFLNRQTEPLNSALYVQVFFCTYKGLRFEHLKDLSNILFYA